MISGIKLIEKFIDHPERLFEELIRDIKWDERMTARKTASFGVAYNYSQMAYPFQPFPQKIVSIIQQLEPKIGFELNNCLINYYETGKAKMGYHSDQIDHLAANTGIAIVSLGETRTLRFRNIHDPLIVENYELQSGSLIYMTQEVQTEWQHAIPKSGTENGRISMTFRNIVQS